MRKKAVVAICELCGGPKPSGTAAFVMFHCLAFCSPDCLDGYKAADEERGAGKQSASAELPGNKRSRAA